jgi:hypothetical protein
MMPVIKIISYLYKMEVGTTTEWGINRREGEREKERSRLRE